MTDPIALSDLQTAVEEELIACILHSENQFYSEYEAMFTYQMDWEETFHGSRGKRVRPAAVAVNDPRRRR